LLLCYFYLESYATLAPKVLFALGEKVKAFSILWTAALVCMLLQGDLDGKVF
jgi:hypothetical protein